MSDILAATETSITRQINGQSCVFGFLNAYDRAELLRDDLKRRQDARTARKEKLIQNLRLGEVTGMDMVAELEAFDNQFPEEVTEQDWVNLVNNPLNEMTIYTRCLAKSDPEHAEELAKHASLPIADKAKLCGLSVVTKKQEEPGQYDPNRSTAAEVYQTPQPENSIGSPPKPE